MAKVYGPLHSMSASGKFGEIVFDKRGFARIKVTPNNPKTAAQGNHRQIIKAVHGGISILSEKTRMAVKTNKMLKKYIGESFKHSYWNGYLLKLIVGPQKANFFDTIATFNALPQTAQYTWEQNAQALGLNSVGINYATAPSITAGQQLFMVSTALYYLNLYSHCGQPGINNAFEWATAASGQALKQIDAGKETSASPTQPLLYKLLEEVIASQQVISLEEMAYQYTGSQTVPSQKTPPQMPTPTPIPKTAPQKTTQTKPHKQNTAPSKNPSKQTASQQTPSQQTPPSKTLPQNSLRPKINIQLNPHLLNAILTAKKTPTKHPFLPISNQITTHQLKIKPSQTHKNNPYTLTKTMKNHHPPPTIHHSPS